MKKYNLHRGITVAFDIIREVFIATIMGFIGAYITLGLKKTILLIGNNTENIPLFITPILGGIFVALLIKWDPLCAGFGTDHYIRSIRRKEGDLTIKTFFSKGLGTVSTIGLNGSGGITGPLLLMSTSISCFMMKIPLIKNIIQVKERKILGICIAASCIASAFNAPIGAGILVVEVLFASAMRYRSLFPAIIASCVGFLVTSFYHQTEPLFLLERFSPSIHNVPIVIFAAISAGLVGYFFMVVFQVIKSAFQKLPFKFVHPILGGVVTGSILLISPMSAGTGTSYLRDFTNIHFELSVIILLLLAKMVATSFTIASGGSAGFVIPAIFIGGVVGNICSHIFMGMNQAVLSGVVIAGMSASLACIANVPIAAAVLLMENSGSGMGVPAGLGAIIGYLIGRRRVIYGLKSFQSIHHDRLNSTKDEKESDEKESDEKESDEKAYKDSMNKPLTTNNRSTNDSPAEYHLTHY